MYSATCYFNSKENVIRDTQLAYVVNILDSLGGKRSVGVANSSQEHFEIR